MSKQAKTRQKGGILMVILVVVAILLLLGYFNIEIKDVVEKPATQSNLAYAKSIAQTAVENFVQKIKGKLSSVNSGTSQTPEEVAE